MTVVVVVVIVVLREVHTDSLCYMFLPEEFSNFRKGMEGATPYYVMHSSFQYIM